LFCQTCDKWKTCVKTCYEIEKFLSRNPDGYSERHIRRKEVPYADTESIADYRAFTLKYGKKYFKVRNATSTHRIGD